MNMNRMLSLLLLVLMLLTGAAFAEEFSAPVSAAFDGAGGEIAESISGDVSSAAELAALVEEAAYAPLCVLGAGVNKTEAKVGETITWFASATGGNGDYAYFFNLFNGDTVVKYGSWQLASTFSYTPSVPGNYYVAAYAVDSRWTEIAGPASEGALVRVAPLVEPLSVSLSVNTSSVYVGETLTWTMTPSGGNGDYAYFYNIFCGSEVVHYGSWQLSPSISFTPMTPGNYYAVGYVVDSRWVEIAQAPQGGLASAVPCPPLSGYAAADRYDVYAGESVKWTAYASGGNGAYLYNFTLYNNGAYVSESGWQADETFTAKLSSPGSWSVVVSITDTSWEKTISAYQQTAVIVRTRPLEIASFTASSSAPQKGDTVRYTVSAKGGTGVYAYKFVLYDKSSGSLVYQWESEWSSSSSVSIKHADAGSFVVEAIVTDSTGAAIYRSQDVTVYKTKEIKLVYQDPVGYHYTYTLNSVIQIEVTLWSYKATQTFNAATGKVDLRIGICGYKNYDISGSKNSQPFYIDWELLDSKDRVISSGTYKTPSIKVDQFFYSEDCYCIIKGLTPGETYTFNMRGSGKN